MVAPADLDALAQQALDAVEADGWDQPPLVILVPAPGQSPDGTGYPKGRTRTVRLGDTECAAVEIVGTDKPWRALIGLRAPAWVDAVIVVNEAWFVTVEDRTEIRGMTAIRDRPDRQEMRTSSVVDRTGSTGTALQTRAPGLNEAGQDTPTTGITSGWPRYLRAYMGGNSPDDPPELLPTLVAVTLKDVVDSVRYTKRAGAHDRDVVVAVRDALIYAFRAGIGPDIDTSGLDPVPELDTWATFRELAVAGRARHPLFSRELAEWMNVADWAAEITYRVGSIESIVIELASLVGHDVARAAYNFALGFIPDGWTDPEQAVYFRATEPGVAVGLDPVEDGWVETIFGVPVTEPCAWDWHDTRPRDPHESDEQFWNRAADAVDRARVLADATDRDPFATLRVPGDVAHILTRLQYSTGRENEQIFASSVMNEPHDEPDDDWVHARQLHHMISGLRTLALERTVVLGEAATAVPFFIDAPTAQQVIGAHLPAEDFTEYLRLPFERVLLVFDQDMTFTEEVLVGQVDPLAGVNHQEWLKYPGWAQGWFGGWGSVLGDLARHGGGLTGVMLRADKDGRMSDWVDWVITTNHDPREQERARTSLLPGNLNYSTLRHVALNLAAYACWGGWTPPRDFELPEMSGKPWRKFVRSSQFRKSERQGAAMGVHVVRVTHPGPGTNPGGDTGSRTVTGHLRRGHWRRSRIAIREPGTGTPVGPTTGPDAVFGTTYTYRENFIAPVAVQGGPSDERLQVYHLPVAASSVEQAPT